MVGCLVLLMANRLELEGAVGDVEVPTKAFAQPIQHLAGATLADARVVHDDVRGQDRHAAGDCPGMQVVDIDHPAYPLDVVTYFGKVHAVRCGLQEYVHDLTEERPGARDDHHHNEQRSDRVEGVQPVIKISTAATTTANEPMKSPSTSR